MDERSITLSTELAAAVDEAVSAGEYGSTSEAVSDAVREWKERRENFGYSIAELRKLVQDGIDSGQSVDGPNAMDRLMKRAAAISVAKKNAA